jgi:hypothetical protein
MEIEKRQQEFYDIIKEAAKKAEVIFQSKKKSFHEVKEIENICSKNMSDFLNKEFPNCVITVSRLDFSEWNVETIYTLVKITCSKVARIECRMSGSTKWNYEVSDFNPPTQKYTRAYGHPLPTSTMFNFQGISDYFKNNEGRKVTEDANIIPGIIDYLKQNTGLKIAYKKMGVGEDGKSFKYMITIKGEDRLGVDIFLSQIDSTISITDCFIDQVDSELDISDPKCFEKIIDTVVTISKNRLNGYIAALEKEIETSQKHLKDRKTLLSQVESVKEKNNGNQTGS